jgi:hypothetical protein
MPLRFQATRQRVKHNSIEQMPEKTPLDGDFIASLGMVLYNSHFAFHEVKGECQQEFARGVFIPSIIDCKR